MGENPQVTHEHHHFYHGGKKVASTSVRLTDQGVIEDVKVMEHNPASKVVSFLDSKYNFNSERLSKLKSKLNTLTSSLDGTSNKASSSGTSSSSSRDEDKLRKKIKQQKKEIENLTKDLKDLQTTASRSIASHQSPILLSPNDVEEPLVSDDYLIYTIKRYLNVLRQGSYGNSATDQKHFLDTLNYLESKMERIVSEKNAQIEKHVSDKIDAERKSKILESERDFSKRELDQKEVELENVLREKDRISKTLFTAEEDINRLQKALEQITKTQEEDAEITQKMMEKIIEKERGRIRKKMSGEYQKEIDDLKNHISQLGKQIQILKETHENRDKETIEALEEAAILKMKNAKLSAIAEKMNTLAQREKSHFEELEKIVGSYKEKNPTLEEIAKGSSIYTRILKDYEELEMITRIDESCSSSPDIEKLKQLLKASIERERKLEDNLGYTINLNQGLSKECESAKKIVNEIESAIQESTYLEKSSLFKQKMGALSTSSIAIKFKSIIDMCDDFAKANSNLREKVKTTQANNELLSQELLQLHKVKFETSSSQKQYLKEKEVLQVDLEEIKEQLKESQKKAQLESENFAKVIQEKQSVIERYKEVIESKGNNVDSLAQENKDRNEKLKSLKKDLDQKQEELDKLSDDHRELGIKCTKLLREIQDLKEEEENKEVVISQLKNQIERLNAENRQTITKMEELEMLLENEKEKKEKDTSTLSFRVSEWQEKVHERELEIEKYKINLEKTKETITTLEKDLDSLKKAKMVVEKDLASLRYSSEDTESRAKDIERGISDKQKLILELQRQIEEQETDITSFKSTIKEQKRVLFEKDQAIDELKLYQQDFKRQLEKKDTEIKNIQLQQELQLASDVEQAKRIVRLEVEKQQHINETLKQNNETLKQNVESLKENNETLKEHFDSLKENNESLKVKYEKMRESNESLKISYESLKQIHDSLKETNESLKENNDTLKENYESLKKQNEGLKGSGDSLKEDFESMKENNQKLNENIASLKNGLASSNEETLSLKQNLETCKRSMDSLNQVNEGLKDTIDSLKQNNESLKQKNESLKQDIETLTSQAEALEQSNESLKAKCNKLNREMDAMNVNFEAKIKQLEENHSLKSEIKISELREVHNQQLTEIKSRYEMDKTSHVSNLEDILSDKNQEIEDLKLKIHRLSKQSTENMGAKDFENEQLKEEVEGLKIEIKSMAEKIRAKEADIVGLTKNLNTLQKEYDTLWKDLEVGKSNLMLLNASTQNSEFTKSRLTELNSSNQSLRRELDETNILLESRSQEFELVIDDLKSQIKVRNDRASRDKSLLESKEKQIYQLRKEKQLFTSTLPDILKQVVDLKREISMLKDLQKRNQKTTDLHINNFSREALNAFSSSEQLLREDLDRSLNAVKANFSRKQNDISGAIFALRDEDESDSSLISTGSILNDDEN